jgi:hypothetical protein
MARWYISIIWLAQSTPCSSYLCIIKEHLSFQYVFLL